MIRSFLLIMSLHSANARLKTSFEAAALANLLFIEYQSNQSLKLAGPWGDPRNHFR
jgi:hypothetical protein